MKGRIDRSPEARRDLVEIIVYYSQQGAKSTVRRFIADAEALFARLAAQPGSGALFEGKNLSVSDLRVSRLARFKSYLVFYRPIPDGIEIIRVLHGARDLEGIIAEDFERSPDDPEETGDD